MKRIYTIFLIFVYTSVVAQDSLKIYNQSLNHITANGMTVLGSWAITNIGVGTVGWATANGGANKYFYQMNTLWGVTNLSLAILGKTGAAKNLQKTYTAAEVIREQKKIEKIFLINAGLDVAYLGTGFYLNHRGSHENSDKLRGYGSAIILQGAFLLLFDTAMYGTQRQNGHKLRSFLEKNPLTFNDKQLGMIINI